jgi:hypothetical protein
LSGPAKGLLFCELLWLYPKKGNRKKQWAQPIAGPDNLCGCPFCFKTEVKMNKKEWYKKWWGVILAISFLPIFAFWWVWKKSKLKAKVKTVSLVLLGGFNLLWYGAIVYASIASVGAPVLDRIKSPAEQQIISVSGFNVEAEAKVKLFLNGNEFQEAKADSKGKFSFLNVSLIEGENKIKASTITKEGKTKESSEVKVVYQRPKPKEESSDQQTEPPKQTETAQTTTEEPKQENTLDKLWKALDSSIKTREGYAIVYNADYKTVRVTKEPSDSWDETAFVKQSYSDFVKFGLVAYQIEGVDDIEFLYWSNMTDQYGKTEKAKGVQFAMKNDEFNKYQWKNLVGQNIYNQMKTSCYTHYIHPAILKNVKTDKLTLLSI